MHAASRVLLKPRHARGARLAAVAIAPLLAVSLLPSSATAAAPAIAPQAVATVRAAKAPLSTVVANARIVRMIAARIKAKPLGRQLSLQVADLTGSGITTYSSLAPRLPASNMKLITAVTAMRTMGVATRFPTTVIQGSTPREMILVGGGDPLLSSANLRSLAIATATKIVAALPVRSAVPPVTPSTVTYSIRIDDSLFAAPTLAPGWPSNYVPDVVRPVRALVRDGRILRDTGADAGAYFTQSVQADVSNTLAKAARKDVKVVVGYRTLPTKAARGAPVLAAYAGHTLGSALTWMLQVSENQVAEMLYRLSAKASGLPTTWAGGKSAATRAMARLGIRTTGLRLDDGSGVSRTDRVTSVALIQLLRKAVSPVYPELASLRSMLPVAGRSGTLINRFGVAPSSCARGRIEAKTGTLHDVVALSGYTTGMDNLTKVFAILVNSRPERTYSVASTRHSVDLLAATVTGCA